MKITQAKQCKKISDRLRAIWLAIIGEGHILVDVDVDPEKFVCRSWEYNSNNDSFKKYIGGDEVIMDIEQGDKDIVKFGYESPLFKPEDTKE